MSAYQIDLINQDMQKMHIKPQCPLYPKTYGQFFNDNQKLNPMTPYKLINAKHPKDGKIYQKLEYNNFYSDWKQDALKWYPQSMHNENESVPNINIPSMQSSMVNIVLQDKNNNFAIPLASNGTNQLNILFNDKCVKSTFNYKRYASIYENCNINSSMNSSMDTNSNKLNKLNKFNKLNNLNKFNKLNNPIYNKDISQETQTLKKEFMDNTVQNSMDLYSSVFEDMYILGYDPTDTDNKEIVNNINSNAINNIRKSY